MQNIIQQLKIRRLATATTNHTHRGSIANLSPNVSLVGVTPVVCDVMTEMLLEVLVDCLVAPAIDVNTSGSNEGVGVPCSV